MFFVAGIASHVGSAAARALLADGRDVRALVRDRAKAEDWEAKGVDIREGDLTDASALAEALRGVEGAFLMQPTPMGVSSGFPEVVALNTSFKEALRRSSPPRLVVLSSVGSEQASELGNITQTHLLEEALKDASFPVAVVRAGGLLENFLASLGRAGQTGVFDSFLQPMDRAFPMAATRDAGVEVARLLTAAPWKGRRVVEVGSRITPIEVAAGMSEALGRKIMARPIPREHWDIAFEAMGLTPSQAANWAEMEDGFNSGWIDFGCPGTEPVLGTTSPTQVFAQAGTR